MIANLSYKDTYGYYGLRAEPSFDELVQTFKKKRTVIPVPKDRQYKWYALGPYRSYILDASKRYSDLEQLKQKYRSSDAEAPEDAAFHTQESLGGNDPAFQAQEDHSDRADAYEMSLDAANQEYQQQRLETARIRREQLSTAGGNIFDPTIMAHSDDLRDAEVPHAMPSPRPMMSPRGWPTEHQQFAAAGIPAGPTFPTYEALNLGQEGSIAKSLIARFEKETGKSASSSYDKMREGL